MSLVDLRFLVIFSPLVRIFLRLDMNGTSSETFLPLYTKADLLISRANASYKFGMLLGNLPKVWTLLIFICDEQESTFSFVFVNNLFFSASESRFFLDLLDSFSLLFLLSLSYAASAIAFLSSICTHSLFRANDFLLSLVHTFHTDRSQLSMQLPAFPDVKPMDVEPAVSSALELPLYWVSC